VEDHVFGGIGFTTKEKKLKREKGRKILKPNLGNAQQCWCQ